MLLLKYPPLIFYQTLIIIAKEPNSKKNIPCFFIPMTSKKFIVHLKKLLFLLLTNKDNFIYIK